MHNFSFGYVYSITVVPTGEVYIGQTAKWPESRWREHLRALEKGLHYNHKLQTAVKYHGLDSLVFREVKHVPLDQLDVAEHEVILSVPKERSLNLTRDRANFEASRKRRSAQPLHADRLFVVDGIGPLTAEQVKQQFGLTAQKAYNQACHPKQRLPQIRVVPRDTLPG